MKSFINQNVFEQTMREGKCLIDENGNAKCAKCGKLLESGTGAFRTFIKCTKCDESVIEATRRINEEKKEAEARKQAHKINEAKKACFEGERAFEQTFANDNLVNREISEKLQNNYVAHFDKYKSEGCGLLLYGGIGTGKTYLARAVLHALIEKGYKAKEIQISKVYNSICANGEKRETFLNELCTNHVVFIDDLGTERTNEGMSEFVYSIINSLYEYKIPIICTTNLALAKFSKPDLDTNTGRVYSRILGASIPLEINKINIRNNNCKALFAEWKANNAC